MNLDDEYMDFEEPTPEKEGNNKKKDMVNYPENRKQTNEETKMEQKQEDKKGFKERQKRRINSERIKI